MMGDDDDDQLEMRGVGGKLGRVEPLV